MKQAFMAMMFLALASACGSQNSDTPSSGNSPSEPAAEPAAHEDTPAAEPQGGGGGGGGGSVCERARECCNAYVGAMPGGAVTAAQACAGIDGAIAAGGAAADASCTSMISGWRQSLTAMNHEVPASCQ